MDGSRQISESLAGLALRYELTQLQMEQLERILDELSSNEHAPSSVREPIQAVRVHIADSLVALQLESVRGAATIVDIGSGAGFPGLPLAVALPASRVRLLDAQARKCSFVESLARVAEIDNAEAVCARVEEWPEGIAAHDLAVVRALAPQPIVLEYAAPLLRLGGTLVDWRGRRDAGEENAAEQAAEALGLRRNAILLVEPYEGVHSHHLHVYTKLRETPDRFPRRVGIAQKRPLSG